MTLDELNAKIADIEALVDERYNAAMASYHKYWQECVEQKKVIVKPAPQRSHFKRQSYMSIDRLKKEYAMQFSPADIGDIIESEVRTISKSGHISEIRYLMRVERIEVAAFDEPMLSYYGTFLKRDGTPLLRQISKSILQRDITKVVKSKSN